MSCHSRKQRCRRGFYAPDAAAALALCLLGFALLSSTYSSAAASSLSQAASLSTDATAVRLSSFLLEQSAATGGFGSAAYRSENEIDLAKLSAADLSAIGGKAGLAYVRVSLSSAGGSLHSSSWGHPGQQLHCASRLAMAQGRFAKLEVCIS